MDDMEKLIWFSVVFIPGIWILKRFLDRHDSDQASEQNSAKESEKKKP